MKFFVMLLISLLTISSMATEYPEDLPEVIKAHAQTEKCFKDAMVKTFQLRTSWDSTKSPSSLETTGDNQSHLEYAVLGELYHNYSSPGSTYGNWYDERLSANNAIDTKTGSSVTRISFARSSSYVDHSHGPTEGQLKESNVHENLIIPDGLPYLALSINKECTNSVDSWGHPHESCEYTYVDSKVVLPKNHSTAVKILNEGTKLPISLTINTVELANCLNIKN